MTIHGGKKFGSFVVVRPDGLVAIDASGVYTEHQLKQFGADIAAACDWAWPEIVWRESGDDGQIIAEPDGFYLRVNTDWTWSVAPTGRPPCVGGFSSSRDEAKAEAEAKYKALRNG